MNKLRLSLHFKITLTFALIISVILIGIYSDLEKRLRLQAFERIEDKLRQETALARTLIEKVPFSEFTAAQVDPVADEIGKDLGLRVTLIDMNGNVLGDSKLNQEEIKAVENHLYRPEVQQALKDGIGGSQRFSTTVQKDMLYVTRTFGKGKHEGFVRLSMPLSEMTLISQQFKRTLAISLLLAFLFAIVFSYFLSILISRPIKEISFVARDIANGNFWKRATISTNDEIEDLAKAINYMSEQLQLRIEEMMTNKSRLEAVFFSMFDGVMIVDTRGSILLMNQTLKDIFDVRLDPIGKKPIEVIRNIEIQEIVERILLRNKGLESRELNILLPKEKILEVHASPIIREETTDGAILVVHDITELKKLEKIRQDFVANVSHELRTPVTTIKGYAETLLEGALNDKENAKDFLKIISSDANRLAQLVDDLLDLSRIESGQLKAEFKECELPAIIDRVLAGFRKQIKAKSIVTHKDIPRDVSKIKADEHSMAQVIANLIDNAIKYNNEGGTITISVKETPEHVEMLIQDTGIGIPQDHLPRIFERFYRVDKARSRELGGTGLGLSIVKHIIQSHHGTVSVESRLSEGSTFKMTIPKASAA